MRPLVRFPVWCAAAHALLWPLAAGAAPCVVEAAGALPAGWHEAVRSLGPAAAGEDDCSSVRVRGEGGGARITLITRDGRRAERRVETPAELAPTLAALRVTFAEDAQGAASDAPAASEGSDAPAAGGEKPPAEPSPPPPVVAARTTDHPAADRGAATAPSGREEDGDRNATLFAFMVGTRGGADSLFSPVVAGSVSLLRSRWELGVIGGIDFRYTDVESTNPSERGGGTVSAGIFVGRREPAGNVELLGGARLSVAAIFYDEDVSGPARPVTPVEEEPRHGGPAEGRLGAYLGMAFPRRSAVRLRGDLVGDAVVGSSPLLPLTPGWAMSGLLGLEFRAL
jgi:hypothetical protein